MPAESNSSLVKCLDLLHHIFLSMSISILKNLGIRDTRFFVYANLIDLDHLLTFPVNDPSRNSFGTHIIHRNWLALSIVSLAIVITRYRWLGLGILFHFFLDLIHHRFKTLSENNRTSFYLPHLFS